ncbi:MAG: extracellular solute-binding protein [Acidimicrobiaceae bacterium]|nr:extracellular solute-binding protein [Acidimicrobiaceae bacterium]MYG55828.1 extracellular solute-binding protein [Acidimicrobiaceae bacterium]
MADDDMADDDMADDEDHDGHDHDEDDGHDHDDEMTHISDECDIPNPAENVEIDIMGWEFPIVTQYAEEIEDCEEGNYSFNYQFLDSVEARNAMTQDAASGSPSFELYQGSNAFVSELANQGFVMALNDLVDKYRDEYNLDQIDQAFWDMASLDGNIYAIPMVSNTMHVFYNEPALAELGIDVPSTFAEAFEACAAIQDAGYDIGFLYMLSAGWAWQIEFDSVIGALGATSIDPVTAQPNFTSPEAVEAATLLQRMWQECAPNASNSYSTDDVQAAFQTGEAILGHTWASRAGAMDDPEASTVVGEIQFAPALSPGTGTLAAPAYIDGWMIPANTPADKVEAIFLAMLAATDLESQEAAAQFGLVTRSGVSHPDGPRDAAAAEASLVNGRGADLTHPAAGIARAKLGEALVTILDGTSVEDALAAAEEAYISEATAQGLL